MKRVRVFFGIACLLISAGSAYATRVLGDAPADYKFYIVSGTGYCAPIGVIMACTTVVSSWPCSYNETLSIAYAVYDHGVLINSRIVCSDRLYEVVGS